MGAAEFETEVGLLGTSARLLALLGLLQTRGSWSGADLAERLDIGERTLRKDVERLRELGYLVASARGPAGGYRLGDQPAAAAAPRRRGGRRRGSGPGRRRRGPRHRGDQPARAGQARAGASGPPREADPGAAREHPRWDRRTPARTSRPRTSTPGSSPSSPRRTRPDGIRFFYGAGEEPVEADPYRLVSWRQR